MARTNMMVGGSGLLEKALQYAPPAVLSIAAFIFYSPSLHYNFQFDDVANIKKMFFIRHHTFLSVFLKNPRWISMWLNHTIHSYVGFNPFLYRLCNVAFHTVTALALFYLIKFCCAGLKQKNFFSTHATMLAYCTSVLFLLHPLQTQTISYVIQGQLEGLAALFMISTCLCFVRWASASAPVQRYSMLIGMYVCAFLACGTKEIAIVLPFLVMLVDWFFVAQGDIKTFKTHWWLHGSLAVLVWGLYVFYLGAAYIAKVFGMKLEAKNNIGNILTAQPEDKIYPIPFALSQGKVILHYLQLFIWPFNMSVEYDWKLVKSFFSLDCIVPFALIASGMYAIARRLIKNPIDVIACACLWFVIISLPRSSIIPSTELMADYKTYAASCGIYFLLAAACIYGIERSKAYMTALRMVVNPAYYQFACITLLILPLGFMTMQRNTVWSSGEYFWANIIRNAPGKARAYNNFAVAISEKGRIDEAIPYYQKAIQMDSRYPDPINNLAVCYSMQGKIDQAIAILKQGIKLQPYYPEGYNNLASFLITKKEYEQARNILNAAVRMRPHYGKAWFNLGKIALDEGKHEEAFEYFKTACTKADLDTEAGFKVYASVALGVKKYDDARIAYEKLLSFSPEDTSIMTNLANIYVIQEKFIEAEQLYAQLLKRNPHDGRSWFNLGDLCYRVGKHEKALSCYTKAKELNPSVINSELRMADCHKALGNPGEARAILERVMAYPNMPDAIKTVAKASLKDLSAKSKTA